MRIRNVVATFTEFSPDDLAMEPQRFEDYKSKYLDIHDRVKANVDDDQKASIIDEVDFELELIRRDNINVAYILALLAAIAESDGDEEDADENAAKKKAVLDILGSEARLRSKRELIEEFIASYMPQMRSADETKDTFNDYWDRKRTEAFERICQEEDLDADAFSALIEAYQFSDKEPLSDDVMSIVKTPPSILKRKSIARRIVDKMVSYLETFNEQMGDIDDA